MLNQIPTEVTTDCRAPTDGVSSSDMLGIPSVIVHEEGPQPLGEIGDLLLATARSVRPLVDLGPPILPRGAWVPPYHVDVEVRHAVPNHEGVDMLGTAHFLDGFRDTRHARPDLPGLFRQELGKLGDMAFGFDEDVAEVVRGFFAPKLRVGHEQGLVLKDGAARHLHQAPVLAADDAIIGKVDGHTPLSRKEEAGMPNGWELSCAPRTTQC